MNFLSGSNRTGQCWNMISLIWLWDLWTVPCRFVAWNFGQFLDLIELPIYDLLFENIKAYLLWFAHAFPTVEWSVLVDYFLFKVYCFPTDFFNASQQLSQPAMLKNSNSTVSLTKHSSKGFICDLSIVCPFEKFLIIKYFLSVKWNFNWVNNQQRLWQIVVGGFVILTHASDSFCFGL